MVQVCGDPGDQCHPPHAEGTRGGGCLRCLDAALEATSGGEFACLFSFCFGYFRTTSVSFEQLRAVSSNFDQLLAVSSNFE
eukprot:9640747-Alexandrium_andersonii.AAC.1